MNPIHALIAILVCILWGLNFIAIHLGAQQFPTYLLIFVRYFLTFVLLFPFLLKLKRAYILPVFYLSMVMSLIYFGLLIYGMQGVPAGEGCIVMQLEVPMAAVLSALVLKDKIKWRLVMAIAISIVGVTLTIGMPQRVGDLYSIGFLILAAFFWAVNSIQMKCVSSLNPFTLNAAICAMALPFLMVIMLFVVPNPIHQLEAVNFKGWLSMGYMVVVSTVGCYSTWFWLLRKYPVSRLSPFVLISPVAALLGAHLFSGEALALHTLAGTLILLVGLALIVIQPQKSQDNG